MNPPLGPVSKVIPLNVCRFVSFSFKAKEKLQRCGDVFFDILITSKGTSAVGMF